MTKIVIVGGGGFTKCIVNYIENDSEFDIVGYTDNTNNGDILGVKYLGNDSILQSLFENGVKHAAIGVGLSLNDSSLKRHIAHTLISIGFQMPILYGKNVSVHRGAEIEEGVVLRDGAVIQAGVVLKAFSMIGDNTVIGHDTIVEAFSHVVMGSTVGRDCIIGEGTFVGYNSSILNGVKIVPGTLIGAKSLVNKSCLVKGTYIEMPASLNIITGTGMSYTRPDGINVISLASLGK